MAYLGDYAEDYATLNFKFNTRQFSTGAPFALAGTPVVSVYKANGATQSTAGITLTNPFDSVVGLMHVLIDLSSDAFYAVGNDYQVVLTAGTIDSVSVIGTVIADFSIENRFMRGTDSANIVVPPSVSQFNARTLVAASYFDPAADTVATVTSVTNQVTADMTAISGDTTAADNLELMYDGTGYTDDTAPSSRSQVDGIGAASGGALNYGNDADNVDAPLNSVTFVGTEDGGTNAVINNNDGVYHIIGDTTNAFDVVYEFDIGGGRTAIEILWIGYLSSSNDTANIQSYNGSSWDTVSIINGKNGTSDDTHSIPIISTYTGTGAALGKVYVRIVTTGQSTPTLNTNQLLVSAVNIGQSVGYAGGAIWVDTINGVAGTEAFVNGVADNPVLTWADALTLATAVGVQRFQIVNGSTITLSASTANFTLLGSNWTLALGGQSIANAHFHGATDVSGVSSGDNSRFVDCHLKTCTLGTLWASGGRLGGTITLISTGGHFFQSVYSSTGTLPIIDLGAVGAQTVCLTPLTGGVEIHNTAAGDLVHIEGAGEFLLDSSCNGGEIEYAGAWRVTDNATSITLSPDDNTVNIAATLVDTGTTLPARFDGVEGITFSTSTDSLEAIRNRGDAAWTTGAGGSVPQLMQNTTIATLATQVSFTLTAGSTDDDAYNGCIVIVTDVSTATQKAIGKVSDYTGSTKTVTLEADPAIFTMAATDTIDIIAPLAATTEDIFQYVIENSETFEQQLRVMRAESAGKVSVSGSTVTFRNSADDADRIVATTDSNGQRTAVTTTLT